MSVCVCLCVCKTLHQRVKTWKSRGPVDAQMARANGDPSMSLCKRTCNFNRVSRSEMARWLSQKPAKPPWHDMPRLHINMTRSPHLISYHVLPSGWSQVRNISIDVKLVTQGAQLWLCFPLKRKRPDTTVISKGDVPLTCLQFFQPFILRIVVARGYTVLSIFILSVSCVMPATAIWFLGRFGLFYVRLFLLGSRFRLGPRVGRTPCLPYVSTSTSCISIICMNRGEAGGQARRRKEVSRRFIHYYFWLNETWGGPALHQHQTIFGQPQKCIPLGGELLLGTINSLQVKKFKMYET